MGRGEKHSDGLPDGPRKEQWQERQEESREELRGLGRLKGSPRDPPEPRGPGSGGAASSTHRRVKDVSPWGGPAPGRRP